MTQPNAVDPQVAVLLNGSYMRQRALAELELTPGRIALPAEEDGFPDSYVAHLKSFAR
jgi:hypothetical protein